jgi:hypothetical protein
MTVVAAIFVPLVLLYQGWSYWVFRLRLARQTRRRGRPGVGARADRDDPPPLSTVAGVRHAFVGVARPWLAGASAPRSRPWPLG